MMYKDSSKSLEYEHNAIGISPPSQRVPLSTPIDRNGHVMSEAAAATHSSGSTAIQPRATYIMDLGGQLQHTDTSTRARGASSLARACLTCAGAVAERALEHGWLQSLFEMTRAGSISEQQAAVSALSSMAEASLSVAQLVADDRTCMQ
jgi:hypothetical protein